MEVNDATPFYLNACPYPVDGSRFIDIIGCNGNKLGLVKRTGDGSTGGQLLRTFANGSRRVNIEVNGIRFEDRTTGNTTTTGIIELESPSFGTIFRNFQLFLTSTISDHKKNLLKTTGTSNSLEITGLEIQQNVTLGSPLTVIKSEASMTGDSYEFGDIYVNITGVAGSLLMEKTSPTLPFVAYDVFSSVPFDGAAEDFIQESESGILTVDGEVIICPNKLKGISYNAPTNEEDYAQKGYIDQLKKSTILYHETNPVSNDLFSVQDNANTRYVAIGKAQKVVGITLNIYGTLITNNSTSIITIGLRTFDLDGTLTALPNSSTGIEIHSEQFTITTDTGGLNRFSFSVPTVELDIDIDGSTTPKGLLVVCKSMTATQVGATCIQIELN